MTKGSTIKLTKKIIFLNLITKIVFMSITAHSDLWTLVIGSFLFNQGIGNIWEYSVSLGKEIGLIKIHSFFSLPFFPYPPLILLTFGFWLRIIGPLISQDFWPNLLNYAEIYNFQGVIWPIFLAKSLYLFFDLGIAFLLWRSFNTREERQKAVFLWLFNPIVFYSLAVGNFDLIPTFLVVLSLFLIKKKKEVSASLALGLGAAYKIFPLFFLPFLLLREKSFKRGLLKGLLGLGPLVLSMVPFWNSPAFRSMALFWPLNQGSLAIKIGDVSLVVVLLIFIYSFFLFFGRPDKIWKYYLASLLVIFSFSHYHLQWFVWLMPLLVMEEVINGFAFWKLTVGLIFSWIGILVFSSPDLHLGLLVPLKSLGFFRQVTPEVTASLSPGNFVSSFAPIDFRGLAQSVFAGLGLSLIYFLLKEEIQSKNRYLKRV